jgi:hypothetical protein
LRNCTARRLPSISVVQQRQAVADATLLGGQHAFQRALGGRIVGVGARGTHGHRELGAADLLGTGGSMDWYGRSVEVQSHAASMIHPCVRHLSGCRSGAA